MSLLSAEVFDNNFGLAVRHCILDFVIFIDIISKVDFSAGCDFKLY